MFESSQLKTWNFVRHGLLSKEGDHERAFRVIEVELAFLYVSSTQIIMLYLPWDFQNSKLCSYS